MRRQDKNLRWRGEEEEEFPEEGKEGEEEVRFKVRKHLKCIILKFERGLERGQSLTV
mgnify:CR=1 FL=1